MKVNKAPAVIGVIKTEVTLNIKGTKLKLSMEELRNLRQVVNHVLDPHWSTTITVPSIFPNTINPVYKGPTCTAATLNEPGLMATDGNITITEGDINE